MNKGFTLEYIMLKALGGWLSIHNLVWDSKAQHWIQRSDRYNEVIPEYVIRAYMLIELVSITALITVMVLIYNS